MDEAAEEMGEARKTYASYAKLAIDDIAKMPAEVKQDLMNSVKFYQNLVKQFNELKQQQAQAVVEANRAMYQQEPGKVEGRGGSADEGGFSTMAADIKWANTKRQMEAEMELAGLQDAQDVKHQARNMSEEEQDQLGRDRHVAKLEQQDEIWAAEEAYLEQKMANEEGALLEAEYEFDTEKVEETLQNINDIGVAEDELAAKRELQKQKIANAAMSYETFQNKRIEGIYAEGGAVKASGALWEAYGDTIGKYASSMADQWKTMFAEMGKESATAWKLYQAIAISQAIIDTYKTAQAGASAVSGIPFIGPALAVAWIATSIATGMMRVQQIRSQKPQSAAKGGVFSGGLDAYGDGGVTSGVATGIIGDNPSGKELVIPSENISKNRVDGYVQEGGGGGGAEVTVVNVLTEEDIADAMSSDSAGQVIVNRVVQNQIERREIYVSNKETQYEN
jgi:hypothetical protein